MRSTARRFAATALGVGVTVALTACGGAGTKASGAVAPLTLTLGTEELQGANPASQQVEEFAREVDRLSGGAIDVEPSWHAAGDVPDWDQTIAHTTRDGDLDLALISSRAFDTEGVTTLRALNAPFVVDSDELVKAIVAHDDLARDLMAGLPEVGVTGLALFPQGLRHPFSFGEPLLGPDDYAGAVIRSGTSQTIDAMFAALGATTTDDPPDPATQSGIESGFEIVPGGTATGNVTFFAKINVLVLGDETRERLSDDQLDVLRRAAAGTRDWAVGRQPRDADAAKAYCAQGGAVVLAPADDVAALQRATAQVTEQLAQDPATSAALERIEQLRVTMNAGQPVEACDGTASATSAGAAAEQHAIDGVYRFEATEQMLRDAGVVGNGQLHENAGLFTFTFTGGTYCWEQEAEDIEFPSGCGTYTLDGDRMTWTWSGIPDETFTFAREDDGSLVLSPDGVVSSVSKAYVSVPWKRIGGAG